MYFILNVNLFSSQEKHFLYNKVYADISKAFTFFIIFSSSSTLECSNTLENAQILLLSLVYFL